MLISIATLVSLTHDEKRSLWATAKQPRYFQTYSQKLDHHTCFTHSRWQTVIASDSEAIQISSNLLQKIRTLH